MTQLCCCCTPRPRDYKAVNNNKNLYFIKNICWYANSAGCLLLVLTLSTAHHGAKATADSSNNNNNNKRVAQVGTNLQLPCTPPEAEGQFFFKIYVII